MMVTSSFWPFLPKESLNVLEDVARLRVFAAASAVAEKVEPPPAPAPVAAVEVERPVPVELVVKLQYEAEFGQVLRLVWWEKERNSEVFARGQLPMTWSEGHVWQCRLERPKRSFICFRFELCIDKVNAVIRREFLDHPGYRTHDFVCGQTLRVWWDSVTCQVEQPIQTTTNHHRTV